jgi:hypothetical protein
MMSLLDRIKGMFNRVFRGQKELPKVEENPEDTQEEKSDVFDTYVEVGDYNFDPKIIEDDSGKTQTIGELIDELDVKARGDRRNPINMTYDPSRDKEKQKYVAVKTQVAESEIDLGYMLEDGEFASHDDIIKALETALKTGLNPEHVNQVRRVKNKITGKYIDPSKLQRIISGIARGNALFEIAETDEERLNGTHKQEIRAIDNREEFLKKGLDMLGNGEIALPNGEYVSKKDIEEALRSYLFETKSFSLEDNPESHSQEENPSRSYSKTLDGILGKEDEKVERPKYETKHVQRTGKRWKVWPLVLAGVATISLGYGINHIPRDPQDNYVAEYKLVQLLDGQRPETEAEVIKRINESFSIGKTIPVPDGVVVHASSDYTRDGANKSQGVIGQRSLKLDGKATIDYISLVDGTGRIVQVTYDAEKDGNVEEAIERAVQEKGFDRNSGRVMLHLSGVTLDGREVKAGWADQQDLIQEKDRMPRQVATLEEGPEISKTQEHFTGAIVVDAPDGTHIAGNIPANTDLSQIEGSQYVDAKGNKIEIKEFNLENRPTQVPDGIQLEWDFDNVENKKAIAGLFATLGIVGFADINRKKIIKGTNEKTDKQDEEPSL